MKTKTNMLKTLIAILTLTLPVLLLTSCEPQNDIENSLPKEQESNDKVTQLLERALTLGTEQEYDAITEDYKKLSKSEMDRFIELKTERDAAKINALSSSHKITEDEKQTMINSLYVARDMRRAFNAYAQKNYKKSINKLDETSLNSLFTSFAKENKINPFLERMGKAPSNNRAQSCPVFHYPHATVRFNDGGITWFTWNSIVNTPNEWPCDYEFVFSGNKRKIRPTDWFADRLLNSYGGNVQYRHANGNTYVIFGFKWTTFWIGHPGLTSINMIW
jgi:hypothetical protein